MRLGFLLVAAFGLAAVAAQETVRTADITLRGLKPADFPRVTTLATNVYAYEQIDPTKRTITANNLIVVTTDGVLVADGQGTVANVARLVSDVAKLTSQPIRYVVVGSEHGDHRGGDSAFPQGTTFIAHPYSQANLRRQAENQRAGGARVIVPTETVADKRALMLGGTEVQILFLGRAHTGGDLEVYLPRSIHEEVFSNRVFRRWRTVFQPRAGDARACRAAAGGCAPAHVSSTTCGAEGGRAEPPSPGSSSRRARDARREGSIDSATASANFGVFDGWTRAANNAQGAQASTRARRSFLMVAGVTTRSRSRAPSRSPTRRPGSRMNTSRGSVEPKWAPSIPRGLR